jgi:hypothetical protein
LTPDVPFSEAEQPYQQCKAFGTPWPLSETDYLCAYDANLTNRGIYWIDADGNRELIYRDPAIRLILCRWLLALPTCDTRATAVPPGRQLTR